MSVRITPTDFKAVFWFAPDLESTICLLKIYTDINSALLFLCKRNIARIANAVQVRVQVSQYVRNSQLCPKSHLLLLGKFEYGGGPIFKVVLEC